MLFTWAWLYLTFSRLFQHITFRAAVGRWYYDRSVTFLISQTTLGITGGVFSPLAQLTVN